MSWSRALRELFSFLKDPSSRGVVAWICMLGFLIYVTPILVMAWTQTQSTDRIVGAIEDLKYTIRMTQAVAFKGESHGE